MVLTDELLKEELSEEEYNKFKDELEKFGFDFAISNLPLFNFSEIKQYNMVNRNIKSLRLENNLTQMELANMLGVSQKEYWRYEQEGYSVNIMKLAEIAMFYNISLDWFSGYHFFKRKPFFENQNFICVNGYSLVEMKKAKEKGEVYKPIN